MSWPYFVKQRPVCLQCGRNCGARHCHWPIEQKLPSKWDGQTWRWPKNPFCTLRCALAWARAHAAKIERANADGARGGPHNEKGDAGPL